VGCWVEVPVVIVEKNPILDLVGTGWEAARVAVEAIVVIALVDSS